ncbi:tumor necrosis factor receptor type 1-associated DEATH domain [Pelobates cultripes]|uniref:Tumor necrosis factor receptor type 1-associated DEATH domain protein n=1 Tax=Pelobates cultripes TaxID=61616 RepID=A0AAD1TH86_PELCU|nr:tumor necrosis factor receptor type 1-associated DEATH domain [Pelobates cultripes]
MAAMPLEWVGSLYFFIQSNQIQLSNLYKDQKLRLYRALNSALSESSENCEGSIEILKIHTSDVNLILYLKFCSQRLCQRFLQDYKEHRVHERIQNNLESDFSQGTVQVTLELKVDTATLDDLLDKEDQCLKHIASLKPTYQKDDELVELDSMFTNMTLDLNAEINNAASSESSSTNSTPNSLHSNMNVPTETSTFQFQDQEYVDIPLTSEHRQKFATLVGKNWKKVGRSLSLTCRALRDPAIENLAFDYNSEGLYEQAYQLLNRFMMGEGKKATLKRLVEALVENELNNIVEALLTEKQNGLK